MVQTNSRSRKAKLIRDANKASAVGRLLLGQISDWTEFLEPETTDYESLPRRQLKSGRKSVRDQCKPGIDKFCRKNFASMDQSKLVKLYDAIKSSRHLEIPYVDFLQQYGEIRKFKEDGYPLHSTVCISLWGLQYRFPEKDFADDLCIALDDAQKAGEWILARQKERTSHLKNVYDKEQIADKVRRYESSKRRVVQCVYSLIECFLNGLAWEYMQSIDGTDDLSKSARKRLEDTSSVTIRDKMQKYPRDIFQSEIEAGKYLIETAKPFRDSLMHPSPFSAPDRFGGYDKLQKIYSIKWPIITASLEDLIVYVDEVVSISNGSIVDPVWMGGLRQAADKANQANAFGAAGL